MGEMGAPSFDELAHLERAYDNVKALGDIARQFASLTAQVSECEAGTSVAPDVQFDQLRAEAWKLLASTTSVHRDSALYVQQARELTSAARAKLDTAYLRLQNLLYQKDYLEREIQACESLETQYQTVPLHSVEEFTALYEATQTGDESDKRPLAELSPHEVMLARLQLELQERKRIDERRKELVSIKTRLLMENQTKKSRLESLETQLEEYVSAGKGIQAKMQGESI